MACFLRCISFDTQVALPSPPSSAIATFGWDELTALSSNFSHLIGSGGYSSVYLARLPAGSTPAALKIHHGSPRLYQIFKLELHVLLRVQHPNIVRLLGYFDDSEEVGALMLEYLPQGNLQEKLQLGSRQVLPWRERTVIAFQLAQAIEYLHERCSPQIVHGDIKSSNLLLDKHYNCKLCDFGSARVGFSSMVQPSAGSPRSKMMMTGSPGYTDPHYLRTGMASKKMDIYGVGVVILELVSGKEAFSSEGGGEMLVQTAAPLLHEILDSAVTSDEKVGLFVDPRLSRCSLDLEEAKAMLGIAALCLSNAPSHRPSASHLVKTLLQEIPSLSFPHYTCIYSKDVSICKDTTHYP